MTVAPIGNSIYLGLTADTKPTTGVITGALFFNTQTGVISYYTGSVWTDVVGTGGGEVNLAANVGTGAGLVFRDKTSVTLNLKTIKAGTGVTITNNTDDITLDATGAGGGEVNTASNFGSSGTGLWKDKNGVDLRFYKIASANNLLTVGLNGTDHMDLTVVEANLAIAYSQLTSVPSTIVKTDQTNTFGAFAQIFPSTQLKILSNGFNYIITGTAIAANRTLTLPLLTGTDTLAVLALDQTFTNKTMSGASNTFTNIPYSSLTSVPSTIVKTDQTQTFGAFDQIFPSTRLKILSNGFNYIVTGTNIAADRTLTLPLLTGTDTVAVLALAQTLTTKTIETDNNTLKHSTTNTVGDILVNTGTKFDRKAKGTGLQVLRVNSGATDIEYASLDSERTGKATASGNASTTVFNIAHGLGSTPGYAFVDCSSHAIARTWTVDATNITVTFSSAPPTGTSNIIIYWRVVAS